MKLRAAPRPTIRTSGPKPSTPNYPKVVELDLDRSNFDWAQFMEMHFVKLDFTIADRKNPPRGKCYILKLGDFKLLRVITTGGACTASRTGESIRCSPSNLFIGGLVLEGEYTIAQAGRSTRLFRGDMAFMDSALEYSTTVPGGLDVIWLNIPRHRIAGRLALHPQSLARKVSGLRGLGRILADLLRSMAEESPTISVEYSERLANIALDVIVMALESESSDLGEQSQSEYSAKFLHRIKLFIELNLGDFDLTPDTVSEHFGVSTRYINRMFERDGTSIARWIRIRRVERCRYELESALHVSESIAQIAFRNGFRSISTFNRVFRDEYCMEPRVLRSKPVTETA